MRFALLPYSRRYLRNKPAEACLGLCQICTMKIFFREKRLRLYFFAKRLHHRCLRGSWICAQPELCHEMCLESLLAFLIHCWHDFFITSWWYFNLRRMIICLFQFTNDKRFARKRITPGLNYLDTGPKLKVNKTSWTSSERLMHAQFTSCDSNFLICFIIWKQCNLIFLKLSKYKQKK